MLKHTFNFNLWVKDLHPNYRMESWKELERTLKITKGKSFTLQMREVWPQRDGTCGSSMAYCKKSCTRAPEVLGLNLSSASSVLLRLNSIFYKVGLRTALTLAYIK